MGPNKLIEQPTMHQTVFVNGCLTNAFSYLDANFVFEKLDSCNGDGPQRFTI